MPILRDHELDILSGSDAQTQRYGMHLGELLQAGDVICLAGDMGSGKTVFSRGIGIGWGSTTPITSPTYNLVHQHTHEPDDTILYHIDCYRLQGVEELDTIGFDDMLDTGGIMLLEWAELIETALPEDVVWIDLHVISEYRRNIMIQGSGERYTKLLEDYRKSAFGIS